MTRKTTSTDLTISVLSKSVESAALLKPPCRFVSQSPERIETPMALHPSGRQRRPSAFSRRRAGLALELADRRHADEDEHDRPSDPDHGGHHVDDAKNGEHGRRLSSQSMSEEGILFLHLAGVLLFVGGSIAAALLRVAAMRRERPSEIALLLRAVRPAVPIVARRASCSRSRPASGSRPDLELALGATWLTLTFVLIAWMVVVGRGRRSWRPADAGARRAPRSRRRHAERRPRPPPARPREPRPQHVTPPDRSSRSSP